MNEKYYIDEESLENFEFAVIANRFEKRKDELLPQAADRLKTMIEAGVSFPQALQIVTIDLIEELRGGNENET